MQEKTTPEFVSRMFRLMADEIDRRVPPVPEPQRTCVTCANMAVVEGFFQLKCRTNVYAVTGELVSCDEERAGTGQILPPMIGRCNIAGNNWKPIANSGQTHAEE